MVFLDANERRRAQTFHRLNSGQAVRTCVPRAHLMYNLIGSTGESAVNNLAEII